MSIHGFLPHFPSDIKHPMHNLLHDNYNLMVNFQFMLAKIRISERNTQSYVFYFRGTYSLTTYSIRTFRFFHFHKRMGGNEENGLHD